MTKSETTGATSYQQSKEDARAARKLQREVADLETKLQTLEQQATAIQKQMTAPDVLTDYVKMQKLQTKLDAVQQETKTTEDAWEEKSIQLETMQNEST